MCVALAGCEQQMAEQPRLEPYETSDFFADGLAMRTPVEGTVPRGDPRVDVHLFEGRDGGELATTFPEAVPLDAALVERGRERYDAFCSHCHGLGGDGDGMVVVRGFPAPPSYHAREGRLRRVPVGHLYDVVSNGLGRMPRFSDRIPPRDRWAIVAYVRALQLSRYAEVDDDLRRRLEMELAAREAESERADAGGEEAPRE